MRTVANDDSANEDDRTHASGPRTETPLREVTYPAPDFQRPVRVWRGPVEVRDGATALVTGVADVHVSWARRSGAHWTVERHEVWPALGREFGRDLTLHAAGEALPTFFTLESSSRVEGVVALEAWMPTADASGDRLVAHWLNLPAYVRGAPLHLDSAHGSRSWAGRSTWTQGPWTVTVDELPGSDWNQLRRDGGVHATHVLEVVRSDGAAFTPGDVEPLLAALATAASYVAGRWTGPALVRLKEHGALRATEWGAVRVTPEHRFESWWSRFLPFDAAMEPLVRLLLDPHRGPLAARLLRAAVSANLEGFVEQQIVLLVTALDQLAWQRIVVEDGGDPDAWDRKKRLDQRIRRLLDLSGVPVDVPARQTALRQRYSGSDTGKVLAEIRNEVVHPKSAAALDALWPHLIDVCLLAQETLDLCLLQWAGYDGRYGARTDRARFEASTVPVPWGAESSVSCQS